MTKSKTVPKEQFNVSVRNKAAIKSELTTRAIAGDMQALRLVAERIFPVNGQGVEFDLVEGASPGEQLDAIILATSKGQLSPTNAKIITDIVAKRSEWQEMEKQLEEMKLLLQERDV